MNRLAWLLSSLVVACAGGHPAPLGHALLQAQRLSEAIEAFRLLASDPGASPSDLMLYAEVAALLGEASEAREAARAALERDPTLPAPGWLSGP